MKPPAIYMLSKNNQPLKFFREKYKAEIYMRYLQEIEQDPDAEYLIEKILLYDYAVTSNASLKTFYVYHYFAASAYKGSIETLEKGLSDRIRFVEVSDDTEGLFVSGYSTESADDARSIVEKYLKKGGDNS